MKRGKDPEAYSVGYGKPPIDSRFPKGRSGNPAGRPRKRALHEDALGDARRIVAGELGRKLKLTEGGAPVTLDVFTAVFRAATVAALRGSPVAQKTVLQIALAMHDANAKTRGAQFSSAVKLKLDLESRRDAWVTSGRDEEDMPVHPSDVEIDYAKGKASLFIPVTDEERAARMVLLEVRDHCEAIIARAARAVEEDGDDVLLAIGREAARRTLSDIDKRLPARLRSTRPKSLTPGRLPSQ